MSEAALGITRSIAGQPWRWRRASADMVGENLAPDDLVTQLLLARGVARDDLDRQRTPTLRGFMPDPSLFRDMDAAAARLADAVERHEAVTISAIMTSTARHRPRCSFACFARLGCRSASISPTV